MKNLVIVESPAKAKTIEKFLGKDYKVMSSYGHIRDLSKRHGGVDVDSGFAPLYEVPDDKQELVRRLKAEAAKADAVWLASDEDREGEAIAWHLAEVLGLDPATARRIVFHEITKPAILHAIANPRGIDLHRVNAQQARRVLDRIVGFELSPVLWRKIMTSLSAGRVQSVAVRLICEREKEIESFTAEPFYRVNARFAAGGTQFKAELPRRLDTEAAARALLEACAAAAGAFVVGEVTVKPVRRSPAAPFTTSTLQQEASRRLGFSVNRTMSVAQRLYEAGRITYMRTDSLNLSDLALADIAAALRSGYGDRYLHARRYHTSSKGAQEAHEAIRPTYISDRTIPGEADEQRLYDLIWRRTVASQMADAELEKTSVAIPVPGTGEHFDASGEVMRFDGFLRVWQPEAAPDTQLPPLETGTPLTAVAVTATQRFTMPPARYTEGSLVRKMEELGIGRPSTYAPTISTIQARGYVERGEKAGAPRSYTQLTLADGTVTAETLTENTGSDKGKLVPTDVGMVVNDFLIEYFPDILDYNFTARVEEKFDDIAEGNLGWQQEIADFYSSFHPQVEKVGSMHTDHKVGERVLGTDPASGRRVSVKIGRFGPVVQIGEASDAEKPRFANLLKEQSMSTITLDEALKLFTLPRTLGELDGETLTVSNGRFGPYVKCGETSASLPKDVSPEEIDAETAATLIRDKRAAEAARVIRTYPEMPGLSVLNGRFGPYLAYKPAGARRAENYRIPRTTDAAALTFDDARALMESQQSASRKTAAKTKPAAKARPAARKTPAKKTAPSKK